MTEHWEHRTLNDIREKRELIACMVIEGKKADGSWKRVTEMAIRLWSMTIGPLPVAGYEEFRLTVGFVPNDGILEDGYSNQSPMLADYYGA